MEKKIAFRTIDATLKRKAFVDTGLSPLTYKGIIKVHGRPVDIKLVIPDEYFSTLPIAYLIDRTQIPLRHLAHLETDNSICYASAVGLPIDLYEPGEAILRVLKDIEKALEISYGGNAIQEIANEFQAYWNPDVIARVMLDESEDANPIDAYSFSASIGGDFHSNVINKSKSIQGYECNNHKTVKFYTIEKELVPSESIIRPQNLKELHTWFGAQDSLCHLRWNQILEQLIEKNSVYLSATNATVGFRVVSGHPIFNSPDRKGFRRSTAPKIATNLAHEIKIQRMIGINSSLKAIATRNTPSNNKLIEKKIAIVGCGTIGSHLAKMLIQAGAGVIYPLELYDNQSLSEGNIGRHLLGFEYLGKAKSSALKQELQRYHPQVQIRNIEGDAIKQWNRLSENDLIIDATGDWNIQSSLNQRFLESADNIRAKAILHSWIVNNGCSVQSFLNLLDDFACFRCLKPKFDGPWRFPAAKTDKSIEIVPASCGDGAYIPYSVAASAMSASLALTAAIDWSIGKPKHRLRTVVLDGNFGIARSPINPSPSKNCPACSSIRNSV